MPDRVIAATVDHGLRPEAAEEAAMVARLCAGLAIPHEIVSVAVEPGNLQDRARDARYAALCRSFGLRGVDTFATGHHADDQAETLLMRLNRGSGLSGLAGIRARRTIVADDPLGEYTVVRPLLDWRRAELAAIVSAAGIEPARDPSNEDDRFDRVQVRRALAELSWLDPLAVSRSAEHLQEAERAVEDAVAYVAASAISWDENVAYYRWGHAQLIEIEAVRSLMCELGAEVSRSQVAQMVQQLRTEGHATLGGVMARRAMHQQDPLTQVDSWRFEREPPRRPS